MPSQGPVKVLIVDDHIGIRSGITSVMNAEWPRISCVGAAATSDEALRLARECQPHVVVLDVNLADVDGLTLIPLLKNLARCEIVVLTSPCNRTGGRSLCGLSSRQPDDLECGGRFVPARWEQAPIGTGQLRRCRQRHRCLKSAPWIATQHKQQRGQAC
jgi:CheY-like chemotaxis protein